MSLEHDTHSHQPAAAGDANMVDRKLGSSARRRLLQGAIAAPAVLALHTGHATAMASNLKCVNNQVDNPVAPSAKSSPADNYVRVQLYTLRPNTTSSEVRYFVRGTDISSLTSGFVSNRFLSSGQWKQVDLSNPNSNYSPIAVQPKWSNGNQGVLAQNGPWVAVRFTADFMGADIIGVVGAGSGGSAVSGSCWSSFA